MRFIAAERTVDVCATSHEVKCLAYVAACHQHLSVAFGIGVGINHIVAIKLLCHCVGVVTPRLHHESVGEYSPAGVFVGESA